MSLYGGQYKGESTITTTTTTTTRLVEHSGFSQWRLMSWVGSLHLNRIQANGKNFCRCNGERDRQRKKHREMDILIYVLREIENMRGRHGL